MTGKLPPILKVRDDEYITTTIFVKYNYKEKQRGNALETITLACVPNGLLQQKYNPNHQDTIWKAGRNAPSRGEEFRVRLSFVRLKQKADWRVQIIPLPPKDFSWSE